MKLLDKSDVSLLGKYVYLLKEVVQFDHLLESFMSICDCLEALHILIELIGLLYKDIFGFQMIIGLLTYQSC